MQQRKASLEGMPLYSEVARPTARQSNRQSNPTAAEMHQTVAQVALPLPWPWRAGSAKLIYGSNDDLSVANVHNIGCTSFVFVFVEQQDSRKVPYLGVLMTMCCLFLF